MTQEYNPPVQDGTTPQAPETFRERTTKRLQEQEHLCSEVVELLDFLVDANDTFNTIDLAIFEALDRRVRTIRGYAQAITRSLDTAEA